MRYWFGWQILLLCLSPFSANRTFAINADWKWIYQNYCNIHVIDMIEFSLSFFSHRFYLHSIKCWIHRWTISEFVHLIWKSPQADITHTLFPLALPKKCFKRRSFPSTPLEWNSTVGICSICTSRSLTFINCLILSRRYFHAILMLVLISLARVLVSNFTNSMIFLHWNSA